MEKQIHKVDDIQVGDELRAVGVDNARITKIDQEFCLVYNERGERCPFDQLQGFMDKNIITVYR